MPAGSASPREPCATNSVDVAISVDNNQAALGGYVHTAVGSDVTDSDCGKGSNANTSQCTTLTVANAVNLDRDCGFYAPACRDGFVDAGEYCDSQAPGHPANCRTDCTACGDGVAQTGTAFGSCARVR